MFGIKDEYLIGGILVILFFIYYRNTEKFASKYGTGDNTCVTDGVGFKDHNNNGTSCAKYCRENKKCGVGNNKCKSGGCRKITGETGVNTEDKTPSCWCFDGNPKNDIIKTHVQNNPKTDGNTYVKIGAGVKW